MPLVWQLSPLLGGMAPVSLYLWEGLLMIHTLRIPCPLCGTLLVDFEGRSPIIGAVFGVVQRWICMGKKT